MSLLVEYRSTEYTLNLNLTWITLTMIEPIAPTNETFVDYDRRNLLTYAELLDADAAGMGWEVGSLAILGIDPRLDLDAACRCWDSHLARARWITGDGLADAVEAFRRIPFGNRAGQPVG